MPKKGDKKRLLEMSEKNVLFFMEDRHKQQEQVDPEAAVMRLLKR